MSGYIGVQPVPQATQTRDTFTATSGQTSFATSGYTPGFLDVFLNGVHLVNGTDYTASNGSDVVLTSGATAGDSLEVVAYTTFQVVDQSFSGNFSVDSPTFVVDAASNNVGIGTSSPLGRLTVQSATGLTGLNTGTSSSPERGNLWYDTDGSGWKFNIGKLQSGTFTPQMTFQDNGNAGIGTSSPATNLEVSSPSTATLRLSTSAQSAAGDPAYDFGAIEFFTGDTSGIGSRVTAKIAAEADTSSSAPGGELVFYSAAINSNIVERARIDASGNLLVGTTSTTPAVSNDSDGIALQANGTVQFSANATTTAIINRKSTDGPILQFRKDGTTVGSIGSNSSNSIFIGTDDTTLRFSAVDDSIRPGGSDGSSRDNAIDLGFTSARFDDIYATNGTIQTSDRNEKQDIAELDEAEKRVAIAAKGLLRKYRWRDAVAEKGDDARIHFGIIAQDLQDAFAAEGLDAGRYAMFISSTWWEADEVIPAVEEVLDEEGNVVTEAQPERTVTNTYNTAEEAPEGATERTRMGVRYSELLAFIIGAL